MHRIRVGVVRGGPSNEYEVSLKTGASVLANLNKQRYQGRDLFISRDGAWHLDGVPTTLAQVQRAVDVVWNALHGAYGEDGKLQRELERFGIAYTGSRVLPSALAMNKVLAKEHCASAGLKVPRHLLVRTGEGQTLLARKVFLQLPPPWVVKPVDAGSSVGVTVVRSFPGLPTALEAAFAHSSSVLVEEYIRGREATCAVVEALRGEPLYALPPIEIVPPPEKNFFDYEAKYGGLTRELCPGRFTESIKQRLMAMARRAHEALGLAHYSRSDFIVHPTRGIYFLETNSLPGLTEESLLPKALAAIGTRYEHFLDHVISLALAHPRA